MIRTFYLAALFFFSIGSIQAAHISNGMIWYEHVGGPTQHHYVVKMLLLANINGVQITFPQLSSKVFSLNNQSDSTLTMNMVIPRPNQAVQGYPNAWRIDHPWQCGLEDPTYPEYGYVFFQSDTLILNPNDEYDIYFIGACCRDGRQNITYSNNLFLRAKLNTNLAPFSLIPPDFSLFYQIIPRGVLSTVGQIARSNDSVALSWSPVYSGSGGTANPVSFEPNYSLSAPFGAGGVSTLLQNQNALMQLQAPDFGVYNMGLKYSVYQFSSVSQTWIETGWYVADFPILVTFGVDSNNLRPLQYDSLYQAPSTVCDSYELILNSRSGFLPSSLDTSGLQFRVLKPDGATIPVVGAEIIDSTRLKIELFNKIDSNGTYQVIPRLGSSGKYLQGRCGYDLPKDTINVVVSGCNSFSLLETRPRPALYPNPSNGKIYLRAVEPKTRIIIYDLAGRKRFEAKGQESLNLDLAPGSYLVVFETEEQMLLHQERLVISQ